MTNQIAFVHRQKKGKKESRKEGKYIRRKRERDKMISETRRERRRKGKKGRDL
jgi:hypothetical protein